MRRERKSRMISTGEMHKRVRREECLILIVLFLIATLPLLVAPVSAQGESVELVLGGDASIPFRIGDVKPGFHGDGYSDVTNNGTIDCALFIWADNITGSYDLGKYLYFNVSNPRLITNVNLPATIYNFPESPDDTKFIVISPLKAGETVRLDWTWQFRETYTPQNEAQGKQFAFEILYTLQCPPPCLLPVADFEATPTSGIAPVTVQFTDRSTGDPTQWLWNFGDGTTSPLRNPSHTYKNPGAYTVTLTVFNACGRSDPEVKLNFISVSGIPPTTPPTTKPTTIPTTCPTICPTTKPTTIPTTCPTICPTTKPTTKPTTCPTTCPTICPTTCPTLCPVPVAGFTANTTQGTAPAAIRFTDQSTGNPTAWLWDFGDGTTSTERNPIHTYRNEGTYTVTLTVMNSCGVSDPAIKINFISVSGIIPTTPPTTVPTTTPSTTPTTPPTTVPTTCPTPCPNCSITCPPTCPIIVVNFIADKTLGPAPFTVQFHDQSTGNPTVWLWDFGDGSTSTEQNPVHVYQVPGVYSVSLIVGSSCGGGLGRRENYIFCTQAAYPDVDFCANVTYGPAPLAVQFYDLSTGNPTTWLWDFGDNTTSTLKNPYHIYQNPGNYYVTLTVTNTHGSDTERRGPVTVNIGCSPIVTAQFQADIIQGSAPITIQFSDRSNGYPTQWFWDFGDGTTSILPNPVHAYQTPGTYSVSLSVFNACGGDQERKENYIIVQPGLPVSAPVADFQVNITSGFVPLTVQFSDRSSGNPTAWLWDFGDGSTSTEQNPTHTYRVPGFYTILLTSANIYGSDMERKENYLCARPLSPGSPPVAAYQANISAGTAPLTVQFSDHSSGDPSSWLWNFGDGTTSIEKNPWHTFTSSGNYTVILTVSNPFGSDSVQGLQYIRVDLPSPGFVPVVDFSMNRTSGIAPLAVQFNDVSSANPESWLWDFGDNSTSIEKDPIHVYITPGTYTITLTVTNAMGTGSKSRTGLITVTGIPPLIVDFKGEPLRGYEPLLVRFTDLSSDSPTTWLWSFGDGTTSTEQNPSHRYPAGIYTVTLKVTNQNGTATSSKINYILTYNSGSAPSSSGGGGGGGGGGGSGYSGASPVTPSPQASLTPIATLSPVSCNLPVGLDKRTEETFQISSPDGLAFVSFYEDTGLTCNDQLPDCIFLTLIPAETLAPVPNTSKYIFSGYSYAIRPECLMIDGNATLGITITTNDWQILGESELSLWWWDAGKNEWIQLPSTMDRDTRRVLAEVVRGGTYALFRAAGTTPDIFTPLAPTPPPSGHDHRIFMIVALLLLSGGFALHFRGIANRTLSDSALILWAAGTIVMILGILYQAFFIIGLNGSHLSAAHSDFGLISLIVTVVGLGAWLKLRNKRHVTSNDYLNWLLVIGIILYYMTVLLAIITA
jgi:PKD repeat protein